MVRRTLPRRSPARAMSILSWNCRGLGCLRTVRFLQALLWRYKPTILFLIETNVSSSAMENIRVCKLIHGWYVGRSGRLSLLWQDRFDLMAKFYSRYHIDAILNQSFDRGVWRLTCVYGESHTHLRGKLWNFMNHFLSPNYLAFPWLCIGDWNEILLLSEEQGGNLCNLSQIQAFRDTVNGLELNDLGFKLSMYTWKRGQGQFLIQEPLDKGLASSSWNQLFPKTVFVASPVYSFWSLPHLPGFEFRECSCQEFPYLMI